MNLQQQCQSFSLLTVTVKALELHNYFEGKHQFTIKSISDKGLFTCDVSQKLGLAGPPSLPCQHKSEIGLSPLPPLAKKKNSKKANRPSPHCQS